MSKEKLTSLLEPTEVLVSPLDIVDSNNLAFGIVRDKKKRVYVSLTDTNTNKQMVLPAETIYKMIEVLDYLTDQQATSALKSRMVH